MNNSIEFLEKSIDYSEEYLGINQFTSLDLAVAYLSKVKDNSHINLLIKVIDGLFNQLTNNTPDYYDSTNPIFRAINQLLDSPWRIEASKKIIELYLTEYSPKKTYDVFIENYAFAIEDQSLYLASEKLIDYFKDTEIETLNEIEQSIYCCHVINVGYAFHKSSFEFNHNDFRKYVKANLLFILKNSSEPVRRLSIWAYYWLAGGKIKDKGIISYNEKWLQIFENELNNDNDPITDLRLSIILIKGSKNIFDPIGKNLATKWAKNIVDNAVTTNSIRIIDFPYRASIEPKVLKSLSISHKSWLFEFIIPYLGLSAGIDTINVLKENLKSTDPIKFKSAIILSGLGVLTATQVETYSITHSDIFDDLVSANSDLCYKVMGRDSTGRVAWYFVLLDEDKKELFLEHQKGDSYDLADYGSIIASGYGEDVPDDVKEMLTEKYGFSNF